MFVSLDTVDHKANALTGLNSICIIENNSAWSIIQHRTYSKKVNRGVPQGSNLYVYVNDLPNCLENSHANAGKFVLNIDVLFAL